MQGKAKIDVQEYPSKMPEKIKELIAKAHNSFLVGGAVGTAAGAAATIFIQHLNKSGVFGPNASEDQVIDAEVIDSDDE
jgi:hypothetical protein